MSDSARFRGSNTELCEFLERKNAELEVERDLPGGVGADSGTAARQRGGVLHGTGGAGR